MELRNHFIKVLGLLCLFAGFLMLVYRLDNVFPEIQYGLIASSNIDSSRAYAYDMDKNMKNGRLFGNNSGGTSGSNHTKIFTILTWTSK